MSLADSDSLDLETRAHDREHDALRLWLRLLTCANMIETDIRSRLRQEFDCTLPRFDLLAQLDRHPEGLKMGELSKRMMVTGGNVTGITDQLEKEGWVTRETVVNDRRAFLIKLTPRGKKAFSNMARAHEGWIEERLGQLPEAQRQQLYALLGDLKSVIA
ncbi:MULTISPECIES: MarR family transcriptional regulator [Pandoraea]|uniref:MarR family winged helix-turn-helix transcriptional regulator n=1 Tax=Pandoraea TaxID=93217 RepID=UPI001F5C7D36|nr:MULTISPECIES: MarR family transcriptional regulator [Pandoraea]MCI3207750.1 MarR family transcriptional regulator [Pandoraea sp. LA3]MDN4585779.1 MarR family transcriptional regulator [Pandoraea capi]